MGDCIGEYYWATKGHTRSSDFSSYEDFGQPHPQNGDP